MDDRNRCTVCGGRVEWIARHIDKPDGGHHALVRTYVPQYGDNDAELFWQTLRRLVQCTHLGLGMSRADTEWLFGTFAETPEGRTALGYYSHAAPNASTAQVWYGAPSALRVRERAALDAVVAWLAQG